MLNVHDFSKMKAEKKKITMITAYDYSFAEIVNKTGIDSILVGDSAAMVMHGYPTTLSATLDMMVLHTAAVAKGAPDKFLIGDLPFLSYRKGLASTMEAVDRFMKAGAMAIKLEGVNGHEEMISQIVTAGVPVMGHVGLTPQSIHSLGGYKMQGGSQNAGLALAQQARKLEELGCFSVVLECVPSSLASDISAELSIPTIGIGAGSGVDGQVLVLQDLLGMNPEFQPKFVRRYLDAHRLCGEAINAFVSDTQNQSFPNGKESYS